MAGPIQLIGLPSVYPNAREITFSGATGENQINIPDNLADALLIQEGSNKYINFVTSDGSERIEFGKPLSFDGATIIDTSGNNLLELDGGTAGVRLNNHVGIGATISANRVLNIQDDALGSATVRGISLEIGGTLASAASASGIETGSMAWTLNNGGTHDNIFGMRVGSITLTETTTSLVTNVASFYIGAAPTYDGNAGDIANGPYQIFCDGTEASRFDGPILSNAGTQTVIAANGNLASANGADFNGAITNLTVVDGIVTAAS